MRKHYLKLKTPLKYLKIVLCDKSLFSIYFNSDGFFSIKIFNALNFKNYSLIRTQLF